MALPTYDKSKRKQTQQQLPKGAYVVTIKAAKEEPWKKGNGSSLAFCYDIAEGEWKGFYQKRFEGDPSEDKKWPNDAVYRLTIPQTNSEQYVWDNWNTFFADLEDSNNGFVFAGDVKTLKGKLIGAKMHIEQSEYNGNIYDHTRMKWTCVADDVRNNKAGKMPKDKLIEQPKKAVAADSDGFVDIPADMSEEIPF